MQCVKVSSITNIITSVRDQKNILEIRLEKQQGASFSMNMQEIESLLRRLGIDTSHFVGVSACPEGKPVVLVRGNVNKKTKQYIYRHCPNRRGGGQPHFKKLKRNDFLTKVGEGGGHKKYCRYPLYLS